MPWPFSDNLKIVVAPGRTKAEAEKTALETRRKRGGIKPRIMSSHLSGFGAIADGDLKDRPLVEAVFSIDAGGLTRIGARLTCILENRPARAHRKRSVEA